MCHTNLMETNSAARAAKVSSNPAEKDAMVREMLERVADKWTLVVIDELSSGGELRFSRLRNRIGGVSQKMLTKTLRQLERDGLVTRRVHAEVPPRVEYRLTRLGESLGEAVCGVWTWVEKNGRWVRQARRAYDAAKGPRTAG